MSIFSGAGQAAASVGSSVAPATATASGLGKWYAAMSVVQALSGIGSAVAQNQAARSEAGLLEQQANIALQEGEAAAKKKAREVRQIAGEQSQSYASSGITLEGSPAEVLAETRRLGQEEVNAEKRRAESQARLLRTQALRTKSAGRMAMFSGLAATGFGALNDYVRYRSMAGTTQPAYRTQATPLPPIYGPNPRI